MEKRRSLMRHLKHQSGMFVIEALISILLFAVGIVGLVMVASQGTNQTAQAKSRNDASYLAGELIGELWVTVNPNGTPPKDLTAALADVGPGWQARVAAVMPVGSPVPTPAVSGTQVTIDIQWPDTKEPGVFHRYTTAADIAK